MVHLMNPRRNKPTPCRVHSAERPSSPDAHPGRRAGLGRGCRLAAAQGVGAVTGCSSCSATRSSCGRRCSRDEARRRHHPGDDPLAPADLADRVGRGDARARHRPRRRRRQVRRGPRRLLSASPWASASRLATTPTRRRAARPFTPEAPTRADDTLLLYFTSGTTAQPKLVEHTHASLPDRAPVDDVLDRSAARRRPPQHLLARAGPSTPGAYVFAPWIAEATIFVYNYAAVRRRRAARPWRDRCTTFCAPPTVWRMLDPGRPRRWRTGCRCARWSARASRSTPR